MNPRSNVRWAPQAFEEDALEPPPFDAARAIRAIEKARAESLVRLIDHLKAMQSGRFTGFIDIHFMRGSLCRVEQYEEILKPQQP